MLGMHEVAVATSITCAFVILAAFSLSEVSDWRILGQDNFASIIPAIEPSHSCQSLILSLILDVYISDHMLSDVVSDDNFVELTIFG